MSSRRYSYVGPPGIRDAALSSPAGAVIRSAEDLAAWLVLQAEDAEPDGSLTATFVVDCDGLLRLAPRRSEHVACAAGGPVLSAGEVTFSPDGDVSEISNHSTGFCPEPESWPVVAAALDTLVVTHPGCFTTPVVFRLCPKCHERNIVKDSWFVCAICGAHLPDDWNFPAVR